MTPVTGAETTRPRPGDRSAGNPTTGDPTGGDATGGDPTGGDPTGGDPTGGDPTGDHEAVGRRGRPAPEPSGPAGLVLTLVTVVLTLSAAAGFARVFTDRAWVGPVVLTAISAHLVSALLRRTRVPPVSAMALCLLTVFLVGVWTLRSIPTFWGAPDAGTLRAVADTLTQAKTDFSTVLAPTSTTPGFVLVASWTTGLVAVLGDWGTFRLRSAVQGLAPSSALFVVGSVLAAPLGRTLSVGLWVAAAAAFGLTQQMTITGHGGWLGGRRAPSLGLPLLIGVAIGASAVLAATMVAPRLPAQDGRGLLGWRTGPAGSGGTRSVESPIVDLHTRIIDESNTPVFTVRSSLPSYWKLTSLDTFTGTLWESTDSYQDVQRRLPGVGAAVPGTRDVVQDFHIENLDSVWLPAAFDPVEVDGTSGVTFDPVSGSLLSSRATSNDMTYQVTSTLKLAGLDAGKLRAAGEVRTLGNLRAYLQLPRNVPPSVVALAHRITDGATTEYAKALAIQDYLLGPLFTYSTSPPTDGYGVSALTTFLLRTRTGYCQQFAGSFAVLARIVGVPTRLAVGFTTGVADHTGSFHVTDANAHTWPEVEYPRYGWVPFEPTKGTGFAIPGGSDYTGSTAPAIAPSTRISPPTVASHPATPAVGAVGAKPHGAGAAGDRLTARGRRSSFLEPLLLFMAAGLGALGLWLSVNLGLRHRRSARRRRLAGPVGAAAVLVAWQEVGERLAWHGLPRRPDETPDEYARRSVAFVGAAFGHDPTWALLGLAGAVNQASFADCPLSVAVATQALDDAANLERSLWSSASTRLRARWWFDPRLGPTGVP